MTVSGRTRRGWKQAIEALIHARPEALAEQDRRVSVELAREDPGEFGAYVAGYELPEFHRLWMKLLLATGLGGVKSTLIRPRPGPDGRQDLLTRGYRESALRDPTPRQDPKPIDRLLFVAPPGHAKTTWMAILWPVWLLGRDPNLNILMASSMSDLAALSSAQVRALIRDNPRVRDVFPHLRIDMRRADREMEWFVRRSDPLNKDPSYAAVGFDGSVTGRRTDVLIIDDPVKDHNQVATTEARDRTWRTYQTVLLTRLNPGAKQVVIATRWHEDDFAGRLIKQGGWVVCSTPAIDEDPGGGCCAQMTWA